MKKILNSGCIRIFVSVALVLSSFSCMKDDNDDAKCGQEDSYIQTDITTYSLASEDKLALGAGEYVIRRCRLYAFDGDKLDNTVYFDNITSGNLGEYVARMKVTQTTTKKLYCIINEPDNAEMRSKLALINNPAAFAQIEYTLADYVNEAYNSDATFGATDFCLPMYGETPTTFSTVTSTPETDIPISMTVTRAVARVDVYLQPSRDIRADAIKINSDTKFDILNTRAKGYMAPTQVPSEGLIDIENAASGPASALAIPVRNEADNAAAKRVFTFYTPERSQGAGSELGFKLKNVDFNGVKKSYTVSINATGTNGLTKIERNKSHKLICTFAAQYMEIIFTATVTKWDAGGIDGYANVDGDGNYHGDTSVVYPWDDGGTGGDIEVN